MDHAPLPIDSSAIARAACENCGAALAGDYCHECGAPGLAERDLSLRRFLAEAAEEFTSFEHSKVLRTLRALVLRPGFLTHEYFSARRVRYIRPVTLCLSILTLHLFAYSISNTVSMFDIGRTSAKAADFSKSRGLSNGDKMSRDLARAAAREKVSVRALEEKVNDRWARNVSLLQIPLILLFAAVLQLAYIRSKRYAVEHWVFSMHFISFQALMLVAVWPLYYFVGTDLSAAGAVVTVVLTLVAIAYLFLASRSFYGDSGRRALVRAPLLYVGYFACYIVVYQAAMVLALWSSGVGS
jgi:hypothetical protein